MGPPGLKASARRADLNEVNVSRLAFVEGMDVTRSTLRRWNTSRMSALVPWSLGALTIVVIGLLMVSGLWTMWLYQLQALIGGVLLPI